MTDITNNIRLPLSDEDAKKLAQLAQPANQISEREVPTSTSSETSAD